MNHLRFSLSLEQRALTNIAIILWSQDDIRHLWPKSVLFSSNYLKIEKSVCEKSLKLQLPNMFKQNLLQFIVGVGLQIKAWVDFHYRFVIELPSKFVWTSVGTINNIKTAKLLVMSGTLNSNACFALACIYCLEDEIKYCWNVLDLSLHTSKLNRLHCVSYWSYCMDNLNGPHHYPWLILKLARSGMVEATRYFFQKVNKKDDNFVMLCARYVAKSLFHRIMLHGFSLERYSGVMMFLLSEMNAEQQEEMFVSNAYAVLVCFLVWHRQSLFLEMIKDKWDLLSKENYNDLLQYMLAMMAADRINDYNLNNLFEEFWQQSPETYKQFAIEDDIVYLVFCLYESENEKFVKLILKYTSINDRKRIILSASSLELYELLIFFEKWNSIEFLIQECSSSWEELIMIRSSMTTHVTKLQNKNKSITVYQWDKFFQLLNCCIFRCKKKRYKRLIYHVSKKRPYTCIEE